MRYKVGDEVWIEFSNSETGAGALKAEIAAVVNRDPNPKYRIRYVAPGAAVPTHQVVPESALHDDAESALAATGKTFGAIADSIKNPGTTFRDAYEEGDADKDN